MANPAAGREIDGRNEPGGEDQRIALAALLGPSVPSALAVGGVLTNRGQSAGVTAGVFAADAQRLEQSNRYSSPLAADCISRLLKNDFELACKAIYFRDTSL